MRKKIFVFILPVFMLLADTTSAADRVVVVPMSSGKTVSGGGVQTVTSTTGRVWMDRNLGALRSALNTEDPDAFGGLFQWGRLNDGHAWRPSGTTTDLSDTNVPGHDNFILAPTSPNDWRSSRNDNLWQGVSGTNNPCPAGFRLPTEAEWDAERQSWSSNNAAGAFASPLKLTPSGYRYYTSGVIDNAKFVGYYWSSTVDNDLSRILTFGISSASMGSYYRAGGLSIRCIKD